MCEVIHIYVGKNQPAPCFATIGAAIEYAGRDYSPLPPAYPAPHEAVSPVIIHIAPGVYREKLVLERPYVTLEGSGADTTVLVYGDYALQAMEDGSKRGTFRTAALRIHTHDVTLRHLTVQNDAGCGRLAGQAIALYADGDRLCVEHCCLLGSQDTLFTAPLPLKEAQPGGFICPAPWADSTMYTAISVGMWISSLGEPYASSRNVKYLPPRLLFIPRKALTDKRSMVILPPPLRPGSKNTDMFSTAAGCSVTVPRLPSIWDVPGENTPALSFWNALWMPTSILPAGRTGAKNTVISIMGNTPAMAPEAMPGKGRIFPVG